MGRGWIGPYVVTKVRGDVVYEIQAHPAVSPQTVHVDHLKRCFAFEGKDNWVINTPSIFLMGHLIPIRKMLILDWMRYFHRKVKTHWIVKPCSMICVRNFLTLQQGTVCIPPGKALWIGRLRPTLCHLSVSHTQTPAPDHGIAGYEPVTRSFTPHRVSPPAMAPSTP